MDPIVIQAMAKWQDVWPGLLSGTPVCGDGHQTSGTEYVYRTDAWTL